MCSGPHGMPSARMGFQGQWIADEEARFLASNVRARWAWLATLVVLALCTLIQCARKRSTGGHAGDGGSGARAGGGGSIGSGGADTAATGGGGASLVEGSGGEAPGGGGGGAAVPGTGGRGDGGTAGAVPQGTGGSMGTGGSTGTGGVVGTGGLASFTGAGGSDCSPPQQFGSYQFVSCCNGVPCQGRCIGGQCLCSGATTPTGCSEGAVCCSVGGCMLVPAGGTCHGGPP